MNSYQRRIQYPTEFASLRPARPTRLTRGCWSRWSRRLNQRNAKIFGESWESWNFGKKNPISCLVSPLVWGRIQLNAWAMFWAGLEQGCHCLWTRLGNWHGKGCYSWSGRKGIGQKEHAILCRNFKLQEGLSNINISIGLCKIQNLRKRLTQTKTSAQLWWLEPGRGDPCGHPCLHGQGRERRSRREGTVWRAVVPFGAFLLRVFSISFQREQLEPIGTIVQPGDLERLWNICKNNHPSSARKDIKDIEWWIMINESIKWSMNLWKTLKDTERIYVDVKVEAMQVRIQYGGSVTLDNCCYLSESRS